MTRKRRIFTIVFTTIIAIMIGVLGAMASGVSKNDLQKIYNKLREEFKQEEKEFFESENPSIEKGKELKQKAIELGKMEAELYPKSSEDVLAERIRISKSAIEDKIVVYSANDPRQAEKLKKAREILNKLEKIENDLKEKKRSIEELQKEFEAVSKIKITE
ncbi:hypothetical protein [Petroclostridium xylanilyticum]|uniref:hypothetical protein n=1 Tax=Petroclostridium xylanilyticum TaxID=1792311 RepID=UPI000B98F5FC|nr:hypothetical protein [Petroclostridium xylanilyticum]